LGPDVVTEEFGCARSSKRGEGRNEMSALGEPIDDDKDCVKTIRFGEVNNKISCDLLPRFRRGGKRLEFTGGARGEGFSLLTVWTRVDERCHIAMKRVPDVVSVD
jgi:hypothetical protein